MPVEKSGTCKVPMPDFCLFTVSTRVGRFKLVLANVEGTTEWFSLDVCLMND